MRGAQGLRFAFDPRLPAVRRFNAEDHLGGFRASGTQQAGEAYNFSRADLQVERGDGSFFTVAFKRRYRFIAQQGTARPLQGIVVQFATQHHFHQLNLRQLAGLTAAHKCAVTQHGDAVADRIDLVEKMGDKDQADAVIPELAHQGEQHLHLLGIEAGGGLVEDQHLGRQVDGPTDSDDLLHRHRKAVQRLAHVEGKAVGGHQRRRPGLHLFTSQQTKPPRLTADEQVIRHRHIGQQVHFLVDGADPQLLGMGGIFGRNSLAFQPDSAAIGMVNAGQRFDQRRFSGAVFAQQGHDFAAPQAKVDVIQRLNAGEEFTKSFGAKDLLVCLGAHNRCHLQMMSGYSGSRWASRGFWNAAFYPLPPGRGME